MRHKKLTTSELVSLLRHMAASVEAGDSFSGFLEYDCMTDQCQLGEYLVKGAYRVGNSKGQGGMNLIEEN